VIAEDSSAGAGGSSGLRGKVRPRGAGRRFGWGLADQAVSSLTNFAVSLYVARSLGAVQFGAFSLAYVTYSFVLNASRGLSTDPLLVRFSGAEPRVWRRAVSSCSGTALAVGLVAGAAMLAVAVLLGGTARVAFVAMGLTMPGLMLQDSWRFAFFALGRGSQAFINDMIWAAAMLPALLALRMTGHESVFWFVLAWGASANVAAAVGPLQARVFPRILDAWTWVRRHRDLALRYLAENTIFSGSTQLRLTFLGVIAGLAAVGYVQAAQTLMGPFLAALMGISLVTVPEAARVLQQSPRQLRLFCLLIGVGAALAALAWGLVLMFALPRGLGHLVLRSLWRPTDPLILPVTLTVMGTCFTIGASAGLRALGSSRRSLRAMIFSSVLLVVLSVTGAVTGGALGTVRATAVAGLFAVLAWWWQLRAALREADIASASLGLVPSHPPGRHRMHPAGASNGQGPPPARNGQGPPWAAHNGQDPMPRRGPGPPQALRPGDEATRTRY
jgi:O-antigen/teichoic acid export membrane protein